MSPQNPNQGGASRGSSSGQSNPQQGGAQREAQQGKQARDSKDTPRTEPTHPDSESGERADRSSEGAQRGGEQGREVGPRFDDRPEPRETDREAVSREQNEGAAGATTRTGQQRSGDRDVKGTPGMPNYGDQEPNDPRRADVESRGQESRE